MWSLWSYAQTVPGLLMTPLNWSETETSLRVTFAQGRGSDGTEASGLPPSAFLWKTVLLPEPGERGL